MIEKIQESSVKKDETSTNKNADTNAEGQGGANNEPKEPVKESIQPSSVAQVENT